MFQDTDIKNLALYAPKIALGMVLGVPRVPFIGDIPIQFPSATVNAPPINGSLDNNLTQDAIVERVAFTLYQPNSFSGSPLQAQYLAYLKACPGVGVQMSVFGGPKYTLNDTFTELSNLADVLAITWPSGWPLFKQSNVKASCVLTQTPTSVPYDVKITLLGWQLLDKTLDNLSNNEARCRLQALGFEVPDVSKYCNAMPELT